MATFFFRAVASDGKVRTRDLGGRARTTDFTDAICHEIDRGGAPL